MPWQPEPQHFIVLAAAGFAATAIGALAWVHSDGQEKVSRSPATALWILARIGLLWGAVLGVSLALGLRGLGVLLFLLVVGTIVTWPQTGGPQSLKLLPLIGWQFIIGFADLVHTAVPPTESAAAAAEPDPLLGETGVATTALRPSGTIRIEEEEHDATTDYRYLPAGTEVRVAGRRGFALIVEPLEP